MSLTTPLLTRTHRLARIRFIREHVNWNINCWANILLPISKDFQFLDPIHVIQFTDAICFEQPEILVVARF